MSRREFASDAEAFFRVLAVLADPDEYKRRLEALELQAVQAAEEVARLNKARQEYGDLEKTINETARRVEDQQSELLARAESLKGQAESLQAAQAALEAANKTLDKALREFEEEKQMRRAKFDERERSLEIREAAVSDRENNVSARESEVQRKLEGLRALAS